MTPADKERQEQFTREMLPYAVDLYAQALLYGYQVEAAQDLL